jgi:hypothetical protein
MPMLARSRGSIKKDGTFPLATNAPAAQPEGQLHVGTDDETGQRLASRAAYPSSLARSALRRQTPEARAACSNRPCQGLCGGCPVMGIPTAILAPERAKTGIMVNADTELAPWRVIGRQICGKAAFEKALLQEINLADVNDRPRSPTYCHATRRSTMTNGPGCCRCSRCIRAVEIYS